MSAVERVAPPYQQVLTYLRDQIVSGALKPGERLPSIRSVAAEWGLAQATVAKAYSALAAEGLTVGQSGMGTVVTTELLHHSGRDWFTAARRTGLIYPEGYYAEIIDARVVTAPPEIAEALSLTDGAEVIRRQRVTRAPDGTPMSTSVSWHTADIAKAAPKLLLRERIPSGPRYVENALGVVGTGGTDEVYARLATDEEAALLGLTPPAAVLVSHTSLCTDDGTLIEYGQSVAPPGRRAIYSYAVPPPIPSPRTT